MNKYIYIAILTLSFTLSSMQKANATHAAGGELLYTWIGGSSYKVIFKFYRDCGGISEPSRIPLCIYNTCNSQSISDVEMRKSIYLGDGRWNGSEVSLGCPNYNSTCEDTGSYLPGFREWWYEATITLPGKCRQWRIAVAISARNQPMNVSSGNLYIEATINNLDINNNSSPQFHTKPLPYVCINTPYTYNNGAIDVDNDSLSFESIIPLISSNCSSPAKPATFAVKTIPLRLPDNPFQTNNSYYLNPTTGNINFTPTELGAQTTTILVKEYRNGILVGSTMRDIQVQVLTCSNPPTKMAIDTASISNAVWIDDALHTCIDKPVSFCFNVTSTDISAVLSTSDNHAIAIPGASINYSNNATSLVRGCFMWTPTAADSGLKILTVTAKDSTCKAPGITVTQTFTIPINVIASVPPPIVTSPQTLCQFSETQPLSATGSNLLWHNLPIGDTGSTKAPIPSVSNIDTTTFYVSQNYYGCSSPRIPISVIIHPVPGIDLLATYDSICANKEVTLSNRIDSLNKFTYEWMADYAKFNTGTNQSPIKLSWPTTGTKHVTVTVSDSKCSSNDSIEVYILPTPVAYFNADKDVCIDSQLTVSPLKQDALYSWTITDFTIEEHGFKLAHKLHWSSPGKKHIMLVVTNEIGCDSTYADSITVRPDPIARIQPITDEVCKNIPFTLKAEDGEHYTYSWQPSENIAEHTEQYTKAVTHDPIFIHMQATNQWHCTSNDSIYIEPQPCCDIFMPDAFSPNNDGLNDRYWSPYMPKTTLQKLVIVDRWGQVVYSTDMQTNGWDGTYNGKNAAIGTYYYFIKYLCNGTDKKFKKGTLILVR